MMGIKEAAHLVLSGYCKKLIIPLK